MFLIDQEGYEQGYRPPNLLYNMIQKGQMPETDHIYTDIKIKNKYNVWTFFHMISGSGSLECLTPTVENGAYIYWISIH